MLFLYIDKDVTWYRLSGKIMEPPGWFGDANRWAGHEDTGKTCRYNCNTFCFKGICHFKHVWEQFFDYLLLSFIILCCMFIFSPWCDVWILFEECNRGSWATMLVAWLGHGAKLCYLELLYAALSQNSWFPEADNSVRKQACGTYWNSSWQERFA